MPPARRVGNPLAAAIVGVVIAAMGLYMILADAGATARVYGGLLIFFGLAGAAVNIYLRRRFRAEDRRRRAWASSSVSNGK